MNIHSHLEKWFPNSIECQTEVGNSVFLGCHSVTDLKEIGCIPNELKFLLLRKREFQTLLCIVTSDLSKTQIRSYHSSEYPLVSPSAQSNGFSQQGVQEETLLNALRI